MNITPGFLGGLPSFNSIEWIPPHVLSRVPRDSLWLSIPLNGFWDLNYTLRATRLYAQYFQFHWMDSRRGSTQRCPSPSTSCFQFHWMDSRWLHLPGQPVDLCVVFQFHWMDSQLNETTTGACTTGLGFQFHWMDSAPSRLMLCVEIFPFPFIWILFN